MVAYFIVIEDLSYFLVKGIFVEACNSCRFLIHFFGIHCLVCRLPFFAEIQKLRHKMYQHQWSELLRFSFRLYFFLHQFFVIYFFLIWVIPAVIDWTFRSGSKSCVWHCKLCRFTLLFYYFPLLSCFWRIEDLTLLSLFYRYWSVMSFSPMIMFFWSLFQYFRR